MEQNKTINIIKEVELEVKTCASGVSIWVDGHWIMDASDILNDYSFKVNCKPLNFGKLDENSQIKYSINGAKSQ